MAAFLFNSVSSLHSFKAVLADQIVKTIMHSTILRTTVGCVSSVCYKYISPGQYLIPT